MIKVTLLLLLFINLYSYQDYDMDGVDDKLDKCPNTLMSELVNFNGCPVKSLISYHHFDIVYGLNFYQTDYNTLEEANTISQSLQLDYYYKNFSVQLSSSYYNSNTTSYNDSGTEDSFLGMYYKINELKDLTITLGLGLIIPTYSSNLNNNNTDYMTSLNLSYMLNQINIFGGYSYTIVNDDDIMSENILYQNSNSINVGLGYYPTGKLYLSSSYSTSDSIYKGVTDIEVLSIYALYSIDENWFTNFTYAYGLSTSASDNFASLRVGYYF